MTKRIAIIKAIAEYVEALDSAPHDHTEENMLLEDLEQVVGKDLLPTVLQFIQDIDVR